MVKLPYTDEVPDELYVAARVSAIMGDEEYGRWRLRHFTVTEKDYARSVLAIRMSTRTGFRREREIAREVPPGEWITLQRHMTPQEIEGIIEKHYEKTPVQLAEERGCTVQEFLDKILPPERQWMPVMSDTPAEILEHAHALNNATGKVVITGLGLGCLPHALLTKDDVTRIDIIDIDPEVIELTGPYLTMDPRVHIWQGSAADAELVDRIGSEAKGWDYAWHDIWTQISARNLDPTTAEHGIDFRTLFDLYDDHMKLTGQQAAWGYEASIDMLREEQEAEERELKFLARLETATLEEQVELIYVRVLREQVRIVGDAENPIPVDGPVPPEYVPILDPTGGLRDHIRASIAKGMIEDVRQTILNPEPDTPLGNPNAHLEVA